MGFVSSVEWKLLDLLMWTNFFPSSPARDLLWMWSSSWSSWILTFPVNLEKKDKLLTWDAQPQNNSQRWGIWSFQSMTSTLISYFHVSQHPWLLPENVISPQGQWERWSRGPSPASWQPALQVLHAVLCVLCPRAHKMAAFRGAMPPPCRCSICCCRSREAELRLIL